MKQFKIIQVYTVDANDADEAIAEIAKHNSEWSNRPRGRVKNLDVTIVELGDETL